jgi:hypothetical protein
VTLWPSVGSIRVRNNAIEMGEHHHFVSFEHTMTVIVLAAVCLLVVVAIIVWFREEKETDT